MKDLFFLVGMEQGCVPFADIVNCVKKSLELKDKALSEGKNRWKQESSEVFGTINYSVILFIFEKGNKLYWRKLAIWNR